MAAPTNHFKLGLFVILSFSAMVVAVVVLGAHAMKKDTTKYHTYFNESVQGLDVGSPVKFRGVTIGFVSAIEIAPDHRHVDVTEELDVKDIRRLGLAEKSTGPLDRAKFNVPPDLRAQLGSQGVTGVKFVAIDFFDPKSTPPPPLPFEPRPNYIPAAPSLMKNLEDTITKAMESVPELVDAVVKTASRIERMVARLEEEDVGGQASQAIRHADQVLTNLNGAITHLDQANLPAKTAETMDDVHKAVNKLNAVLDKVDGESGLIASITRTSDAFGTLGRGASGTNRELESTLREVREAAESIRVLTDALERDPDMFLKGRAKAKAKSEK
ncbi:MAG: MCE family protein [Labilithrix sp.]|nr:MCE family protein [Labilithrix sp.]MCW5815241.1 MCE family protein [Labilithrix sp.]